MSSPIKTAIKALDDSINLVSILHLTEPYIHLRATLTDANAGLNGVMVSHAQIHQWLTSLRREIGMRRNVYPKFVAMKRLTEEEAAHEIACMQGIHDYLQRLFPPPPQPGDNGQLF